MKSGAVTKINNIGKVGQMVARIGEVVMIIVFAVGVILAAALGFIQKDMFTAEMRQLLVLQMDMGGMGIGDIAGDIVLSQAVLDEDFSGVENGTEIIGRDGERWAYTQNGSKVELTGEVAAYRLDKFGMLWIVVLTMLEIASVCVVLHFVAELCKAFRYCQTPFSDEVISVSKKLVISIIPMVILSVITKSIGHFMMTGESEVMLQLDWLTLLMILLVLLLAAVFQYGAMLQRESDETL